VVNFASTAHATSSPKNRFIKTGGHIINNTGTSNDSRNYILFGNNLSTRPADNLWEIKDDGTKYFLPVLGF
jgi:hypothetical protein